MKERIPKDTAVIFHIHSLDRLIRRGLDSSVAQSDMARLTGLQARVICFIADAEDTDVYQRDIEAELNVRRSTVSGILRGMEKNGLVERVDVAHDARLKKLVLTQKALERREKMRQNIIKLDGQLCSGISEAELVEFLAVISKMKQNLMEVNEEW